MNPADNIKRFFKNASVGTNPKADDAILNELIQTQRQAADEKHVGSVINTWRIIMHSKITKFATAACLIFAAALVINLWNTSIPTASAATVFDNAIKALSNLKSVYITRLRHQWKLISR